MESKKISTITINGRFLINNASLNNVLSDGNYQQTRTAVVLHNEKKYLVPQISGDTFKHLLKSNLINYSLANGLPLCKGCEVHSANGINDDEIFMSSIANESQKEIEEQTKNISLNIKELTKEKKSLDPENVEDAAKIEELNSKIATLEASKKNMSEEAKRLKKENNANKGGVLSQILQRCVADAVHGFMITLKGLNGISYKSIISVSPLVGVPGLSTISSQFKVKYSDGEKSDDGGNKGQNIRYDATNSSYYNYNITIYVSKIGFIESENTYALDEGQRNKIYQAVLQSVEDSFNGLNLAGSSQDNPIIKEHIGVICYSTSNTAPRSYKIHYKTDIEEIKAYQEKLITKDNTLGYKLFNNQDEFSSLLEEMRKYFVASKKCENYGI